MLIRCWGSRGSISVSGKEYLKYGGDTTCLEIRTSDDQIIIIDSGTGIRRLGKQLLAQGRYNYDLLFTHAHWDHLMGFPFFRPLYLKECQIRVHSCPFAKDYGVEEILTKVMSVPNFPIDYSDIQAKIEYMQTCPSEFEIGGVTITPIEISHPNGGSGFRFTEHGKRFVFLTDNELGHDHPGGLPFESYEEFARDADLLVHDAEYTEEEYVKYKKWGHSAYTWALDLAVRANVKQLGLFHLNQDRSDEEMDEIVAQCRNSLEERGSDLDCFAVSCYWETVL